MATKNNNLIDLIEQYKSVCNQFIRIFCDKQDLGFEGWVGNEGFSGLCEFSGGQYTFNLSDIAFDLNTGQPKGLILDWLNEGVEFNMGKEKPQFINYFYYSLGLRYEQLQLDKISRIAEENILEPVDEVFEKLKKELEPFKNTLVITDYYTIARLVDVESLVEDYYWVFDSHKGIEYLSCCLGWTALKGFIPDDDYNRMCSIWNLNHEQKAV